MESYWSMTKCDVTPFLMARGAILKQKQLQSSPSYGVLKESNMSTTDASNDSEDDEFATELEDDLMSG
jgi:hypothetical protein